MNKIDKIFNDKLGQNERPVSAEAWGRVASGLQAKKQKGFYFWMQLAAGLSLIAVASVYLLLKDPQEGSFVDQAIVQNNIIPDAEKESESSALTPIPEVKEEKSHAIAKEADNLALLPKNKVQKTASTVIEKTKESPVKPIEQVQLENETVMIADANLTETTHALPADLKPKPISINIVLTGKATESNAIASTGYEDEEKQSIGSKMKKILDKAQEFKYSEGALADLRMAKDDFLNLELKKEITNN
jgi:hypothetical protein